MDIWIDYTFVNRVKCCLSTKAWLNSNILVCHNTKLGLPNLIRQCDELAPPRVQVTRRVSNISSHYHFIVIYTKNINKQRCFINLGGSNWIYIIICSNNRKSINLQDLFDEAYLQKFMIIETILIIQFKWTINNFCLKINLNDLQ